jgi:hypothetical protein
VLAQAAQLQGEPVLGGPHRQRQRAEQRAACRCRPQQLRQGLGA